MCTTPVTQELSASRFAAHGVRVQRVASTLYSPSLFRPRDIFIATLAHSPATLAANGRFALGRLLTLRADLCLTPNLHKTFLGYVAFLCGARGQP